MQWCSFSGLWWLLLHTKKQPDDIVITGSSRFLQQFYWNISIIFACNHLMSHMKSTGFDAVSCTKTIVRWFRKNTGNIRKIRGDAFRSRNPWLSRSVDLLLSKLIAHGLMITQPKKKNFREGFFRPNEQKLPKSRPSGCPWTTRFLNLSIQANFAVSDSGKKIFWFYIGKTLKGPKNVLSDWNCAVCRHQRPENEKFSFPRRRKRCHFWPVPFLHYTWWGPDADSFL